MKILIALDTSAASQAALEGILRHPWPEGSSFEVLSIIEPSHVSSTTAGIHVVVQRVEELVARAVERLRALGWEATGGAMADDDPKIIILDRAQRLHADLVVVGSHSRSATKQFLLGSVSKAVLRYAPCSVEIVRAGSHVSDNARIRKILFATDGSEFSNVAAASLAARPWPPDTEIRVFSVPEILLSARKALMEVPFLGAAIETARAEGLTRSREALESAARILDRTASTKLASSVDDVKGHILKEAEEWSADLIVLGSHGLRGIDRFQLGSVAEAVAFHASCSVEVVRKRSS